MAFLMAFIILIKSSDALHWAYFPNKCFVSNAGQLAFDVLCHEEHIDGLL